MKSKQAVFSASERAGKRGQSAPSERMEGRFLTVRRKSQKKKRDEACEKEASRFFGVLEGCATGAGK